MLMLIISSFGPIHNCFFWFRVWLLQKAGQLADGKPTLHPRLPEGWKKVQMQVHWQGKDWLLTAEEGQQA